MRVTRPSDDTGLLRRYLNAGRGQAGDAEFARAQFEESLRIDQQLYEANPNSAQAARGLLVSLERMGDATAASGHPRAAEQALDFQRQALDLAVELREQNPGSVYFGRTAAVALWNASRRAVDAGDEQFANVCLSGCYAVLNDMVEAGSELDDAMLDIYRQLQARFDAE